MKKTKTKISFDCNISGVKRKVDLLVDTEDTLLTSEIEDIVKQIKKSIQHKTPKQEFVRFNMINQNIRFFDTFDEDDADDFENNEDNDD